MPNGCCVLIFEGNLFSPLCSSSFCVPSDIHTSVSAICLLFSDICPNGQTVVYNSNGIPTNVCEQCDIGEYKNASVSPLCQACSPGFSTAAVGATECLRK